jgi:AraC-like DNA-binding protein
MRIEEAQIYFYNLQRFSYRAGERRYTRLTHTKLHYSYRLVLVNSGRLGMELGGVSQELCAGDVVLLRPGEVYRICPVERDFSLINLFFGFCEMDGRGRSCVFSEDFKPELCPTPITFSDASVLNSSGVLDGAGVAALFREISEGDAADPHFSLFARARLHEILRLLIVGTRRQAMPAEEILAYINANPTEDLSAESLEKHFGYHRNHVNRLLKSYCGKTLTECVRHSKIIYAVAEAETGASFSELASELGYYDYSHFYKAFEKEMGVAPGEYRGEA